jgi:2-succinyl-5-enolpyruvyl-6-hydroxy-3-cyclohexene-1-carboxylate synthase
MRVDDAPNINHLWAALLIEELTRAGVCGFCLSPGSRNTPLAMAAMQQSVVPVIMHFDERGAAFHALGWARGAGRPAVLICTSGSAAANYWPAVVEASKTQVPLMLLTADRPPELLDCGANQAIDQTRLYGGYTRWSLNLPCPDTAISPAYLLSTVDQALYRALRAPAGPVHLNCAFREPLAPVPRGGAFTNYLEPVRAWMGSNRPYTTWNLPRTGLTETQQREIIHHINGTVRGLLVVGRLRNPDEARAVRELTQVLNWPLFPDALSGLRVASGAPSVVAYYDQMLLSESFRAECRPEFVLHLGGEITSKRLIEHLEALHPRYGHVADHPLRHDPMHLVTDRYETDLTDFCAWLKKAAKDRPAPDWNAAFTGISGLVEKTIDGWLAEQAVLTEIHLARIVSCCRPPGSLLFFGNSMPVRDLDMYGAGDGAPGWIEANRGASGIDGNIATAAGLARGHDAPVTAVLGDLAALHDLNSLALIRDLPLTLIIVNNDGGGIFSFLPIAEYPEYFEACFGTPHGMDFSGAAKMFGIEYTHAETPAAFETLLRAAGKSGKASIIEVKTNRSENLRAHRDLQQGIVQAIAQHE